jgi:hypothetical protein
LTNGDFLQREWTLLQCKELKGASWAGESVLKHGSTLFASLLPAFPATVRLNKGKNKD